MAAVDPRYADKLTPDLAEALGGGVEDIDPADLLPLKEVAYRLGVNVQTVYRWARELGILPCVLSGPRLMTTMALASQAQAVVAGGDRLPIVGRVEGDRVVRF